MHPACPLTSQEDTIPPKPGTTNLRAKGKLMADAAEKFRGLSRGLLPAERRPGETESSGVETGHSTHPPAPILTSWD